MKKPEKKNTPKALVLPKEQIELIKTSIKDSLLVQKSEILNKSLEFKTTQSSTTRFSDEADQTAQELENNIHIQLHDRERKSLLLIEKTLSKFSDGSYGECESCGDEIDIKRLQARPMATMCISCMEELEDSAAMARHLLQ